MKYYKSIISLKKIELIQFYKSLKLSKKKYHLYTKYKIIRTNTGFKYYIDSTYQGNGTALPNNNVSYNNETVIVNLYQINAL